MATTVRVLTWNVLGLRRPGRVAALVRGAEADVVCLQECPRWPGGALALRVFARAVGLRVAAGGGRRGVAVLVRPGIEVLSGVVDALPRRFTGLWWSYPRASALAHLRLAGGELHVASVHLDVGEEGRLAHARRLASDVVTLPGTPHVVAGDLNEGPDGAARLLLSAHLRDCAEGGAPTYPATAARRPRERIDAVLADPRLAVVRVRTGPDRAELPSDHLPLLVELRLPDGAPRSNR